MAKDTKEKILDSALEMFTRIFTGMMEQGLLRKDDVPDELHVYDLFYLRFMPGDYRLCGMETDLALYEFYNVFPENTLKAGNSYDITVQAYDRKNMAIKGAVCKFKLNTQIRVFTL